MPRGLTDEEKRKNKRERNRVAHHVRRAAGPVDQDGLRTLLAAQDRKCAYCRAPLEEFHVDHKTPISRGGTNALSNLHYTCPRCNMIKRTMTHEEFLVSKKRRAVQWGAE
jgi:5-methylcytosine-specific restriction endonuclease McrA